MIHSPRGRMLLSHNFDLVKAPIPALSRLAFLQVMAEALKPWDDVTCTEIDNPHWMVDIGFDPALRSPQAVGECCAQALFQSRLDLKLDDLSAYAVLVLGGIKTSPALGPSPTSLQPGQWGVDVVETASIETFLQGINWDATIAAKPPDQIFKVELTHPLTR